MPGGVLTLNAGSSTLKCALFATDQGGQRELGRELFETGGRQNQDRLAAVLAWAERLGGGKVRGVGHRVVHGGMDFTGPVRIGPEVAAALEALSPLAPLHQPQSLEAVRLIAQLAPDLPQTASFDTAFHASQPEVARRFGIPRELHDQGVRRYGFHGINYQHVAERLAALDPQLAAGRVIVFHLGAGASLCAMKAGVSVDTTMGFSPLDGLVMSTRPGLLDPGVVLHLIARQGFSAEAVEDMLYHRSGLLGVSGLSGDMRTLLASDAPEAGQAVELFVYRAAREVGALASSLGGLDGVVFTAGIGEHSAEIRGRICERLAWLGVGLDETSAPADGERRIDAPGSKARVWVIPADEEQVIAREARAVLALG